MNSDMIGVISTFLIDTNMYLLNKNLYEFVKVCREKYCDWKKLYNKLFFEEKLELLALDGDYNWMKEYERAKKFKFWKDIQFDGKCVVMRGGQVDSIPKEVYHSAHIEKLIIGKNKINEISDDIKNMISLKKMDWHYNSRTDISRQTWENLSHSKIGSIQLFFERYRLGFDGEYCYCGCKMIINCDPEYIISKEFEYDCADIREYIIMKTDKSVTH